MKETPKLLFLLTLLAILTSCNNDGHNHTTSNIDTLTKSLKESSIKQEVNLEIVEIDCDSVYKDKGYKLKLIPLDIDRESEEELDFVFVACREENGQNIEILRDTIESTAQVIKFCDYNNDNIKDILIQNISDVRSNWTFNLYCVDIKQDKLIKIRRFNEIKNPNFIVEHNLIDNYVNSGRNWTSFYKIQSDSIIDFKIVIYDEQTEDEEYQKEYKSAINKILNK